MELLLVGCGGFAAAYVKALLSSQNTKGHVIRGIVDPYAERSPVYEMIRQANIPVYQDIESFYRDSTVPLAVICTPIGCHVEHSVACMRHGSHVLLEKPIAANAAGGTQIIEAAKRYGVKLGIGFQLCYSSAVLALKRDIDAGRWGRPLHMRWLILWQRDFAYYARTGGWAGRMYGKNGEPIFDCILTNAVAHYLMNMLWLSTAGFATCPATACRAYMARANAIETFDTVAARFALPSGGDGTIYASHAAGMQHNQDPAAVYEFENGTIQIGAVGAGGADILGKMKDGSIVRYGVCDTSVINKVNSFAECVAKNGELVCPGEAALAAIRSNELFLNNGQMDIHTLTHLENDGERVWRPGLADQMVQMFESGIFPDNDNWLRAM